MTKSIVAAGLALALASCQEKAPVSPEPKLFETEIHYGDLSLFRNALQEIENGQEPDQAFSDYMSAASAGFQGWTKRYNVSSERFVDRVSQHASIFERLPDLEDDLRDRESEVQNGLKALRELAGSSEPLPVYYFVSSQHQLAGTPVILDAATDSFAIGVAVGVEPLPTGSNENEALFDEAAIADLLVQIAVHEGAHILQVEAQGSLENYRSIYGNETGSMLAIAVREGCAEYLTYLATGLRFGNRHLHLSKHEKMLWEEFKDIADEPPFSVPGWFSGSSEQHPDWPFQIGYSLGFRICEAHHQTALGNSDDVTELFALYDPEDIRRMADGYDKTFSKLE